MIHPRRGVLVFVTPAVAQQQVTSTTYPYMMATVTAPSSPLGEFAYELEIDDGHGWLSPASLWGGTIDLRSGQSKDVPIYALSGRVRYRLRTKSWEAQPSQLHGVQPTALLPLLSAAVSGVREGAQLVLHHL